MGLTTPALPSKRSNRKKANSDNRDKHFSPGAKEESKPDSNIGEVKQHRNVQAATIEQEKAEGKDKNIVEDKNKVAGEESDVKINVQLQKEPKTLGEDSGKHAKEERSEVKKNEAMTDKDKESQKGMVDDTSTSAEREGEVKEEINHSSKELDEGSKCEEVERKSVYLSEEEEPNHGRFECSVSQIDATLWVTWIKLFN